MANFDKSLIGAGLYDAYIRDSSGNIYDIHAVVTASADVELESVEVKGDDSALGTFYFNRKETLTIEANGINFDVIQAITGNTLTNNSNSDVISLGEDNENNPPFVEVVARTRAKTSDGVEAEIVKTWHKVQLSTPKVTQEGESEFKIELTGVAYQTEEDIMGNPLDSKRVATLEAHRVS